MQTGVEHMTGVKVVNIEHRSTDSRLPITLIIYKTTIGNGN